MTHITLILTTIYNLVQKPACVHRFHQIKSFEDNFILLMAWLPSFELRFLCKLCLGYMSPVLHDDAHALLKFSPDEVSFIITCFNEALISKDCTSSAGFSAEELLDSVHSVVNIGNNLAMLVENGLLNALCAFLNNSTLQKLTLLFVWSILSCDCSAVVSQKEDLLTKITNMTPNEDLVSLQQCVVFIIKQDTTCTGNHSLLLITYMHIIHLSNFVFKVTFS